VARFESLERELRVRGVRRYGLIGKCRPDAVTPELAHELRALGVVRMFVGIENASQAGQDHLDRRTTTAMLERALSAFREAGIFTAYNLLLFEPDATLDDIRENARFLRRHAGIPGNFCRAEPFHGTPLHRRLAARGALLGDHLGWDYRIADDRVELAFRLTLAAFRERNYAADGVGNRHVGLGYMAQLLRVFLDAESPRAVSALARADQVLAEVARDSADGLEWASDTVERLDPRDAEGAERAAVELAQRITTQDRKFSRAIDRAMDELQVVAALARAPRRSGGRGPELAQRVALAGAMLATAACGGELSPQGDCGSPPSGGGTGSRGYFGGTGGVTLKVPPTDGGRGGAEGGQGGETAPRGGSGGGTGGYMEGDGGFPPTGGRVPTGGFVGDGGSPPSGGMLGDGGSPPSGGFVGDGGSPPSGGLAGDGGYPPTGGYTSGDGGFPPTAGVPSNLDGGAAGTAKAEPARRDEAVDHWRDTMPAIPSRSSDLPLHTPPPVILEGWAETGKIRVVAHGATAEMDLLWAGPGERDGRGSELVWTPGSPRDRLTLVVRHPGGVASTSLLAADANGAG